MNQRHIRTFIGSAWNIAFAAGSQVPTRLHQRYSDIAQRRQIAVFKELLTLPLAIGTGNQCEQSEPGAIAVDQQVGLVCQAIPVEIAANFKMSFCGCVRYSVRADF